MAQRITESIFTADLKPNLTGGNEDITWVVTAALTTALAARLEMTMADYDIQVHKYDDKKQALRITEGRVGVSVETEVVTISKIDIKGVELGAIGIRIRRESMESFREY
ncbi:hypothetical protein BTUL_0290g00030 [Botrytis tulipae]|uniref:Uncharacterized protein n=1 Tax=Botrytis tulipae TaxID=87230 RepID=A0A4Z1E9Q6_9HELO|nr:hypothetical protein BTUL_0290g00030 [Botrytis tulipae]